MLVLEGGVGHTLYFMEPNNLGRCACPNKIDRFNLIILNWSENDNFSRLFFIISLILYQGQLIRRIQDCLDCLEIKYQKIYRQSSIFSTSLAIQNTYIFILQIWQLLKFFVATLVTKFNNLNKLTNDLFILKIFDIKQII